MSLPLPWVDRIFEKLTLVYGQPFLARWRDLDLDAVKHDWATELAGFERHSEAIAHALRNLPSDSAPTVLQFRDLARKAPAPDLPRLPEPKADPARVAAELAKLAPTKQAISSGPVDHKAWAKRLIARHEAGERLNMTALRFAREALGIPQPARKTEDMEVPA